jgi:hypothetical protein
MPLEPLRIGYFQVVYQPVWTDHMSLFKRVKDRLTSPKARVSLQLGKDSFVLGENAEGTIVVSSDEEFDAEEIRTEIECVEKAKRVRYEYDSLAKRDVQREVEESRTLYSAKPQAAGPLHITQGFSRSFPVSVNIPAAGTPTFHGFDPRVSWFVKGVIAVHGRPDVTSLPTEIQVYQASAEAASPEKEVIREVVVIKTPCKNCGALMPETDTFCPNCGAKKA